MKSDRRLALLTLLALLATSAPTAHAGSGAGHKREHDSKSGTAKLSAGTMTKETQSRMTPAEALERLRDGNERFASGRTHRRDLRAQVTATSAGQYPFASVVSCLDSRASSELILDQGIGDIFNARVAGNVVNDDILGSLEFASKVAGSKLIVVLGHTSCGAVKGAVDRVEMGHLTGLLQRIEPAVATAAAAPGAGERTSSNVALVERSAKENVLHTMKTIREESPILREMLDSGQIGLAGGLYDLGTGRITWLDSGARTAMQH